MKTLKITALSIAAAAALASSASAATIIATLTNAGPKYGGLRLHFSPSTPAGLSLTAKGKEDITFTGLTGPLLSNDLITAFSSQTAVDTAGVYEQGGFSGAFNETYLGPSGKPLVVAGVTLVKGVTSVLSGSFTDGVVKITGNKGVFWFNTPSYTDPFGITGSGRFADHFLITNGLITIQKTGFLHSFNAVSHDGQYFGAVPEAAAWLLMLVGFGGVGAALRRRRMPRPSL